MTGDVCRAITGRLPRRTDKRKKRKPKKRPDSQNPSEEVSELDRSSQAEPKDMAPAPIGPTEPLDIHMKVPAFVTNAQGHMSPRKQALMRHKTSSETVAEPSFVSEVKEIKKSRKTGPTKPAKPAPGDAIDGKYSSMLAGQPMEEKASLFQAPMARIVSYHEKVHDSPVRASPGTLLAHGEFEIFQLHGGDVTYLACGKNFVYPLLPKLKMLRTSECEFVLPLVNPQRYWKINIDSADETVFLHLESVLQRVVNYTNLAFHEERHPGDVPGASPVNSSGPGHMVPDAGHMVPDAGHVVPDAGHMVPDAGNMTRDSGEQALTPVASQLDHYTPFFSAIPESPPSVPASPHNTTGLKEVSGLSGTLHGQPAEWEFPSSPQNIDRPFSSAMANLRLETERHIILNTEAGKPSLFHPQSGSLANPFFHDTTVPSNANGRRASGTLKSSHEPQQKMQHTVRRKSQDAKSEGSSMDSLLDEYEETISVTMPGRASMSRPDSRATSHISAARSTALRHNRPLAPSHHGFDHHLSQPFGRSRPGSQIDGVPTTSLSRYEKHRQSSHGGRSRQSSISELYSSTSNWMEPGHVPAVKKLASSRSTYSLAPSQQAPRPSLNETYREIYRSITSRDLSSVAGLDKSGAATAPVTSRSGAMDRVLDNKPQAMSAGMGRSYSSNHPFAPANRAHSPSILRDSAHSTSHQSDGLSSSEVFKLLSKREKSKQPQPPSSGLRRLFGW